MIGVFWLRRQLGSADSFDLAWIALIAWIE